MYTKYNKPGKQGHTVFQKEKHHLKQQGKDDANKIPNKKTNKDETRKETQEPETH
jgi:hypothetical protein